MGVAGNNIPATLQTSNIKSGVSIFGVVGTLSSGFSLSGYETSTTYVSDGSIIFYYKQYGKQYILLGAITGGQKYRIGSYSYLTQTASQLAVLLGGTLKGYICESGSSIYSNHIEYTGSYWNYTANSNFGITMIELN